MTQEELVTKLQELFLESGYQQTLIFLTKSGIEVPATDALREGFFIQLVLTEVKK